mmetsp:Transcript_6740/g.9666  ORF Transcript_6740/g.9666 Transcript_6740/m.9666 type:complete len:157 (+) Transcript_6740:160-630(+)
MFSKPSFAILLLGLLAVNAEHLSDMVFMSLKEDLNSIGVKESRIRLEKKVLNAKKVSLEESIQPRIRHEMDDFDKAEEGFFHAVENIERNAVNMARNLVYDEVDVLFGKDHGHSHSDGLPRRPSSSRMKEVRNSPKVSRNERDKSLSLVNFMVIHG